MTTTPARNKRRWRENLLALSLSLVLPRTRLARCPQRAPGAFAASSAPQALGPLGVSTSLPNCTASNIRRAQAALAAAAAANLPPACSFPWPIAIRREIPTHAIVILRFICHLVAFIKIRFAVIHIDLTVQHFALPPSSGVIRPNHCSANN